MKHPDESQLAAFLEGRLAEPEQLSVERHVEGCEVCCETMSCLPADTLSARLQQVEPESLATPNLTPPEASASASGVPPALVDHPRYRVLEPLGKGGMGVVFKAEHRMMDRVVAIKVIDAKLTENPQAVERFRSEVRAAGKLSHANIVRAYDAEQAGDLHFLVMEYVDGISLAELVRRNGPLPFRQAAAIVRKVAHGLHHAFRQGMVHRDIKPQNIMVTHDGKVRVLDFGLARLVREREPEPDGVATMDRMRRTADALTMLGSVLGTPDYIAPEQVADSRQADTRADIYSLGCTCYFLLCGRPPYPGGNVMEKLIAHTKRTPTPLTELRNDLPAQMGTLVTTMMSRLPDERFQTPLEVASACDEYLSDSRDAESTLATTGSETLPPQQALPDAFVIEDDQAAAPTREFIPARETLPTPKKRRSTAPKVVTSMVGVLALVAVAWAWSHFTNDARVPDKEPDHGSPSVTPLPPGEWVDLIARSDPGAAVEGRWERRDKELLVDATAWARVQLADRAPTEYDLEVTFTRRSGKHSIALIFVMNEHQATFDIDAWGANLAGVQNIDGSDLRVLTNPTRAEDRRLMNGRQYTVLLQVRRDSVSILVDGAELPAYHGDGTNLSLIPQWQLPGNAGIGIGAYLSATTFHQIRMRAAPQLSAD